MIDAPSRILVIDDEEVVLDACTLMLEGGPHTVATASDGTLGLQRIQEVRPDLVFVDLRMPGLSGLEVIERIHTSDPSIVIVVITGYATLDSAVEAMQKGASDYVPKPFTPDEFRLVTRRSLEKRRLLLEAAALRREREVLRENFAAIVSHELKSPLAAVQQNLMLLAGELSPVLTEPQRVRLDRIKTRIGDLLGLIQTWLRVFSADIGKIAETFKPVSVAGVVSKAVDSAQPYAIRKNIDIVTQVHDDLRPVLGDEGTLVEAIGNIVGNAVKYTYPNGRVSVIVEEHEGQIRVSVADTGIGISPEELPRIFGDFYRGKTAQAEDAGAGLGLAITRRIIETHHGTITAASKPGEGSTFVVALPAMQAPVGTEASTEAQVPHGTR
jgi:signal transduction histidine kinase